MNEPGSSISRRRRTVRRFLLLALIIVLIMAALSWWLVQRTRHGQPAVDSFLSRLFSTEKKAPEIAGYHTAKDVLERETIIELTNKFRKANEVPGVNENFRLDSVAQLRARDIFERQEMEDRQETLGTVTEMARKEGYRHTLVGENIGRGMFFTNKEVMSRLTESQEAKKILLQPAVTDIGVALQRGLMNGQHIYIVVQVLGARSSQIPDPVCTPPPQSKLREIEGMENEIKMLEQQRLELYKYCSAEKKIIEGLQAVSPESRDNGALSKRIADYNKQTEHSNRLMDELRKKVARKQSMVDEHNQLINAYNLCLGKK